MGIPGVQAPTRLGRYELLARLAAGGMGEIFLARLEGAAGFEKLFVVKRILPHLADDARFRQMLIAEARLAAKLNHANICQVYELGETDGQLYIVMEYLEGITILPLLRKASKESEFLAFGFLGGVLQQTCDALHYAHELKDRGGEDIGIVHRDVTPANLFVTDAGVVKVLDFGIAKVKDASSNTQTGTIKGKYAYMSPEQLRGTPLDRRADVFALGVVLFEMLALRRLFQRKTDYLTFRAVMEQPVPDVRKYRPDVPAALADAVARALDRDSKRRFPTARQFGAAILDAMPADQRPWTQGEIGDFVRTSFAEEIAKRHEQVATAVERTNAGQRSAMAMFEHGDTNQPDDDDDSEFPSVDSTVNETPYEVRATTGEFIGGTPPPFGVDSTSSVQSLQPFRGLTDHSIPPALTVSTRPRSVVWPLLAIAMVGVAGGALFLVWKQMQHQGTIQIIQTPDVDARPSSPRGESQSATLGSGEAPDDAIGSDRSPDGGSAGDGSSAGGGSGSGGGRKRVTPPAQKEDRYKAVIVARGAQLTKCKEDHEGMPGGGIKLRIEVSVDGRATTISLEPAGLNTAPLGKCIKGVLASAAFPKASERLEFSATLR